MRGVPPRVHGVPQGHAPAARRRRRARAAGHGRGATPSRRCAAARHHRDAGLGPRVGQRRLAQARLSAPRRHHRARRDPGRHRRVPGRLVRHLPARLRLRRRGGYARSRGAAGARRQHAARSLPADAVPLRLRPRRRAAVPEGAQQGRADRQRVRPGEAPGVVERKKGAAANGVHTRGERRRARPQRRGDRRRAAAGRHQALHAASRRGSSSAERATPIRCPSGWSAAGRSPTSAASRCPAMPSSPTACAATPASPSSAAFPPATTRSIGASGSPPIFAWSRPRR